MNLQISSMVLDNDVFGKNGRGTVYRLKATITTTISEVGKLDRIGVIKENTIEYGLLEELAGTFNREAWLSPFKKFVEEN